MTEQNLCKDCKYYRKNWLNHILHNGDGYLDECTHPDLNTIDSVTGKVEYPLCRWQRNSVWDREGSRRGWGKCKEQGLFWEKS